MTSITCPVAPAFSPGADENDDRWDPETARALRADLVRALADDVSDPRVLEAMLRVPRHLFVRGISLRHAYANMAASIGHGQTISQPAVVAIMTEALELSGDERVLEIGTGSGYQAAILSMLASEVYSVEVGRELADDARERLRLLGYRNVEVRAGDGYQGWPEHAPFDRIIITAAPEMVPEKLFEQLREGGVLVVPIGPSDELQRLHRHRKSHGHISDEDLGTVRFVPMAQASRAQQGRT